MPARALPSNAMKFSISTDAGVTWVDIGRVTDIGKLSFKRATVDVTGYDSGAVKEFVGTISEIGSITVQAVFINDTTQDDVVGLISVVNANATPILCRIDPNNATLTTKKFKFSAIATGWDVEGKVSGAFMLTSTFQPTGTMTIA